MCESQNYLFLGTDLSEIFKETLVLKELRKDDEFYFKWAWHSPPEQKVIHTSYAFEETFVPLLCVDHNSFDVIYEKQCLKHCLEIDDRS